MFNIILPFIILIASFYILLKSADYLISSSSEIGKRLGISKFVIGLTIVAVGTSLPELFTAIISIYTSSDAIPFIFGTVVGSNIANILLVFSILLLVGHKFKVKVKVFDVVFLILSTVLMIYIILRSTMYYLEGILLLTLFITYIFYSIQGGKKKELIQEAEEIDQDGLSERSILLISIVFFFSLVGLNLGARGVVYGIENIGFILGIPLEFLTLTTVAFATSLPEIVVTFTTAKKSEFDIAVGNIIGSNISNILLVVGVSAMFGKYVFDSSLYYVSLIFLAMATISFIYLIFHKKAQKYHGIMLLLFYLAYVYLVF